MRYLSLIAILLAASAQADDWELLPGTGRYGVYALESDGERLYGGGKDGVYFSLDDGLTWRESDLKRSISGVTAAPDAMYAVTWAQAVYRSETRGNTWHRIDDGLPTFRNKRGANGQHIKQMLVTRSGVLIATGFHDDTYISRDYLSRRRRYLAPEFQHGYRRLHHRRVRWLYLGGALRLPRHAQR